MVTKPQLLALLASPRTRGNSDLLLETFLEGVGEGGGEYEKVTVSSLTIAPCNECLACENTGECVIRDDMDRVYPRLLEADKLVVASPIFFYGLPAHFKALIDRCQALWYRRRLMEEGGESFSGGSAFSLLVGATRGKKLFDGALLTLRYFYLALGLTPEGALTYREVEAKGEIAGHHSALEDARRAGWGFIRPD